MHLPERTRYIALAEALKARETAGSERKKMECAEKKATDAEHSIREAENEVEMRKERALVRPSLACSEDLN